jgi:hypothetical protein
MIAHGNANEILLAAARALADSRRAGDFTSIPTDRLFESAVLLQARRNQMLYGYLSAISRLTNARFPPHLMATLQVERAIQLQMATLFQEFVSYLNRLGVEYLIGKTYKVVPYSVRDIDFLIKNQDYDRFKKGVKRLGGSRVGGAISTLIVNGLPHLGPHQYKIGNILGIDPYLEIPWIGLGLLKNDEMWEQSRREKILDVECQIPSVEADLLWLVISAAFSDGFLPLLDMFYLSELLKVCNPDRLSHYAIQEEVSNGVYGFCKNLFDNNNGIAAQIEYPYRIPLGLTIRLLNYSRKFWLKIDDLSAVKVGQNAMFKIMIGRLYRNFHG